MAFFGVGSIKAPPHWNRRRARWRTCCCGNPTTCCLVFDTWATLVLRVHRKSSAGDVVFFGDANSAGSFVLYVLAVCVLSADLGAARCLDDLRPVQGKGDSDRTQERREGQRTRAGARAARDAHGALIEIKSVCILSSPARLYTAQRLCACSVHAPPARAGHGARHRATGYNPPRRCCEAARYTQPWQMQRGGGY
jgi:hypothetical protein